MTPLQVVVLAAGRGSRLASLGDDRPKWLLEVAGRTIAQRQLAALGQLSHAQLAGVTVVTGHAAGALEHLTLPRGRRLHNPEYERYNNWYSVLCALQELPADARVVVMNGDLCAEPSWLLSFFTHAATTSAEGVLAIDFARPLTEESMKVSATEERTLRTIGKHGFADPVGEYVGLLMATGEVLTHFRAALERFAEDSADAQQWYEGAVGRTAAAGADWELWATPDSSWVEIDNLDDLSAAQLLHG